MKRISIVTGDFPPSSRVGALRPFRLAQYLSNNGWFVDIITKHPDSEYLHNHALMKEINSRVNVHYIAGFGQRTGNSKGYSITIAKSRRLFARAKGTAIEVLNRYIVPDIDIVRIPFYVSKLLQVSRTYKTGIVLTTSPVHSIHLAGLIVKQIKKKMLWIVDFRDPWDDYPKTGKIDVDNIIEKTLKNYTIRWADSVVSATQMYNAELISNYSGINENKFNFITNSYDPKKTIAPAEKHPGRFIISYTGIFYPDKDPFTFFRALKSWLCRLSSENREKIENILEVRLIGSHTRDVEKIITELGLTKIVKFLNRVPHEEAIRLARCSDMLLICSGIGRKSRPGWLPSKFIEYLGCRIPILAICREGEMARIIRETKSGYVITEEDHDLILTILEKNIKNKLSRNEESEFLFRGIEKFTEKETMTAYGSIIEKLYGIGD